MSHINVQVPRTEERPKALLELLGRARGVLRGSNALSTSDTSTVCKSAVSCLQLAYTTKENDAGSVCEGTAGRAQGNGKEKQADEEPVISFPLGIDQEVGLTGGIPRRRFCSHSLQRNSWVLGDSGIHS